MAMPKGRRKPIEHGTAAGYRMHLRYGPPPCDDCRRANTERVAARRAQLVDCVDCGRRKPLYSHYRCCWCSKKYTATLPKKRKKGFILEQPSDDGA